MYTTCGLDRLDSRITREFDFDDLVLALVDGWGPADTRVPLGTGGLLGLPVNGKLTGRKAGLLAGLPFVIPTGGTNQIDAVVLLTAVKELGNKFFCLSWAWMLAVRASSETGALVVPTWVIKCGLSCSQVSVRCTDVTHPTRTALLTVVCIQVIR